MTGDRVKTAIRESSMEAKKVSIAARAQKPRPRQGPVPGIGRCHSTPLVLGVYRESSKDSS